MILLLTSSKFMVCKLTVRFSYSKISKRFYPGNNLLKKIVENLIKPNNANTPALPKSTSKEKEKLPEQKQLELLKLNAEDLGNLNNNHYKWYSSPNNNSNKTKNAIIDKKNNTVPESIKEKISIHSQKAISEDLLLIPSFIKKNYVSGLMTLTPIERELLISDMPLGHEFREFLLKLLCKVNINFFGNKNEIIVQRLKSAFDLIYKKTKVLQMSKELEKVIGERIIPFTQNFIVIAWNDRTFNYDTLKEFCKEYEEIKLHSFENMVDIKILTFSEATNVKILIELLRKFNIENYSFFLTEPENISKLPLYFSNIESFEQTGQKNADVLIGYNGDDYRDVTKNYHKIYYDIKSFVLAMGIDKCRFGIFHGSKKLYDRLFNDILTSLQRNIEKNIEYEQLFNVAQQIKKKKLASNEKYLEILELLIKAIFKNKFSNIKPSFCIDIGEETDSDNMLTSEMIIKIKEFAKTQDAKNMLLEMFPIKPLIDNKTNRANLLRFFEEICPDIKDNFNEVISQ